MIKIAPNISPKLLLILLAMAILACLVGHFVIDMLNPAADAFSGTDLHSSFIIMFLKLVVLLLLTCVSWFVALITSSWFAPPTLPPPILSCRL